MKHRIAFSILIGSILFLSLPKSLSFGANHSGYSPYPVPGPIQDSPRMHSLLVGAGGAIGFLHSGAAYLLLESGYFLQDWFSVHSYLGIPLHSGQLGRKQPFELGTFSRLHFLPGKPIGVFGELGGGLEWNRNGDEARSLQPFAEAGAGLEFSVDSLIYIYASGFYHLSVTTLNSGGYFDLSTFGAKAGLGLFF